MKLVKTISSFPAICKISKTMTIYFDLRRHTVLFDKILLLYHILCDVSTTKGLFIFSREIIFVDFSFEFHILPILFNLQIAIYIMLLIIVFIIQLIFSNIIFIFWPLLNGFTTFNVVRV